MRHGSCYTYPLSAACTCSFCSHPGPRVPGAGELVHQLARGVKQDRRRRVDVQHLVNLSSFQRFLSGVRQTRKTEGVDEITCEFLLYPSRVHVLRGCCCLEKRQAQIADNPPNRSLPRNNDSFHLSTRRNSSRSATFVSGNARVNRGRTYTRNVQQNHHPNRFPACLRANDFNYEPLRPSHLRILAPSQIYVMVPLYRTAGAEN